MPASFTTQFSRQLAEICALRVKEAEAGELIRSGTVYVCPGANHMRVSPSGRLLLDDGPRVNGHRPSADLTLESVADYAGPMGVAVVLTGMGNDGAKGVQALKAAGGHVIVQDESTSVIFGMPSEAIRTGAVDEVQPLDGHLQRNRAAGRDAVRRQGGGFMSVRTNPPHSRRGEPVVIFRIGGYRFVIASAEVEEIRDLHPGSLPSAIAARGGRQIPVIAADQIFGVQDARLEQLLVLKIRRVAVAIGRIEGMAELREIVALPQAFHGQRALLVSADWGWCASRLCRW